MGMFRIAGVVVAIIASQALGASTVSFQLGIGGDNHAVANRTPPGGGGTSKPWLGFTPGNPADDQIVAAGSVMTWEARVTATGTHGAGPFNIQGVANFVFDLELRAGSAGGPTVGVDFISTYNNGSGSCDDDPLIGHCGRDGTGQAISNEGVCNPCFAGSAFAFGLPVGTVHPSLGPARVVDQLGGSFCDGVVDDYFNPNGGPNFGVFLHPTCEPGKLYGVGAGYAQWIATGSSVKTTPGLGVAGMLGADVPVVEGQIDTTGLPSGTYVLVLTPGDGINVLRGDKNLAVAQDAFAIAADNAVGDTITFEVGIVVPEDFELVSAVSRKNHGFAGDLDVDLPIAGATSEPRPWTAGPGDTVRLKFSDDVFATDGTVNMGTDASNEIQVSSGSPAFGPPTTVAGDEISFWLSAPPTVNECFSINLSGLEDSSGNPLTGDTDVHFMFMFADVAYSGFVDSGDQAGVKGNLFQIPDSINNLARFDVNKSGFIDSGDQADVKASLFTFTLSPCP